MITRLLEDMELDTNIQIATFHPNYQFEQSLKEDVENWTNKSPYPIIHLLQVDDVARSIESYPGDTNDIWKKNIAKMKDIGKAKLNEIMDMIEKKSRDKSSTGETGGIK